MAMENSAALSNDAISEIASASRVDLPSFEKEGTQPSGTEESLREEKPKDALDPEGDFVDAEAVAEDESMPAGSAVDANSSDLGTHAKGGVADDDENGSIESFDSALERMAVASSGDPASPEGPSSPISEPAETTQQIALRQLNQMCSGVSSLDTVLLQNIGPVEFKMRVEEIANTHGLSADSEDVVHILSVLLPLVEGNDNKPVGKVGDVGSEGSDDTNVLDNAEVSKQEISSQVEANGDVSTNQAVDLEGHPMEAMQSHDVDDDADTTKKVTTTLDIGDDSSKGSLPADSSNKSSDVEAGEDRVRDGTSEIQASKINDFEQEPEVIDWDALNESDVDDHVSSNAQLPHSEVQDRKEIVGGESVDSDGLQQETGTSNAEDEPKASSAAETEEKKAPKLEPEAALPAENAVMDSANEPKVQHTGVYGEELKGPEALEVQETSGEVEGSTVEQAEGEVAGTVDNAKEVDVNKGEVAEALEQSILGRDSAEIERELPSGSEDYEQTSAVAEQPPAEVVVDSEEVEAKPREFEVEGQADGTDENPEQASARAENSDVSKQGAQESEALGAPDVSEGLEVGSATQVPDPKDNEPVEPQLLGGLSKGDESEQASPAVEAAGGASEKGESSVHENASLVPALVDSKKEDSMESPFLEKTADVSSKEESVDEKPSLAAATVESSKASTPGNDGTSSLGGAGPSLPVRPAGLGRSVPSLEHAPRAVQRSSAVPASVRQALATDDENGSSTDVSEGSEDAREKLQMIRVKFLRLANRLGQSAHNVVVAQVLYRLGLAEQLRGGRGTGRTGAFSFERASALAEEQEAAGTDDLEFGCTIMVLGKSGVGKSATINSLFDEVKSGTNAYSPATNKVQEIIGTVHGIKLRVIDTPGLLTSFADQRRNERIMSSVKRFIKKSPPDIVLYFDRLDMQSRDYGDLPLLRTITDTFGSAVWFNAIVVLTHASSAPPDGANGVPVSYEMFVAQRSHVVQQTIRQAAGDMRLMNPVSLVENHAACRRNRAGERVLPNGQVWKPQLLLLCFASKILAEANSLLKLQDNSPVKPFGVRSRVPPLPFLLSSLLQSRAQLKLPDEQIGSDDESEDESDEEAESEGEEEYDDLPPFRRLTKDELKLLDKEQRKIYAEELEYREKLFMKKQLKDERARKKELKRRMAALPKEMAQFAEENLEDENASASVPVPMPDMALPPSFDSDNPTYRYRYLDTANQWLVRPVLETHGWDHDSGYDGLNVEKMFVISKKIPVSVSGQVTKDKKEANLQMECAASFKNGEGKFTQTGLDIQTIGKDLAYTLRSETRFDNFKRNKTTCGLAVTLLGDTVAAGMKIEDRLLIGKRVKLVFNGGALTGRGDVAYGGSLEATIRDKDYPIGQFLSTFGLSVMDWHGDLAIGGNLQVQCKLGKTMTIVRGNLNNRKAGQISIRVSNSEQLQIALIGLIPLLRTFINNRILSSN